MSDFFHISILLEPCLEALQLKPDGVYIDATLGGAGHSFTLPAAYQMRERCSVSTRDSQKPLPMRRFVGTSSKSCASCQAIFERSTQF